MTNAIAIVEAQMLIRNPVDVVFEAFVNPEITKNFWFTRSSGKLTEGTTLTWEWEMYNVSTKVVVEKMIRNEKIIIQWDEPSTTVEFAFKPLSGNTTYVVIKNYGFHQSGDELLQVIKDATGGFTTVLDGLKAYLEHHINLNLVADKFPKEVAGHGM